MKLTLKSVSIQVNQRIDNLAGTLENHISDSNLRFREIGERFDAIDQRFDQLRRDIIQDLAEALSPHITAVEEMLANHEQRITVLEESVPGNAPSE